MYCSTKVNIMKKVNEFIAVLNEADIYCYQFKFTNGFDDDTYILHYKKKYSEVIHSQLIEVYDNNIVAVLIETGEIVSVDKTNIFLGDYEQLEDGLIAIIRIIVKAL